VVSLQEVAVAKVPVIRHHDAILDVGDRGDFGIGGAVALREL